MHNKILKKKYQVFTPEKTVREMLLLLKRRTALYGKSFLENSCGDGRFILGYVSMYVVCGAQALARITKIGYNTRYFFQRKKEEVE